VTGSEFLDRLAVAIESHSWHWFRFHVDLYRRGIVHPLFMSLMTAVTLAEERLPGIAMSTVSRIGGVGGRERNDRDYEQLLQVLAELYVVVPVVLGPWPDGTEMALEPVAGGSAKNPELAVKGPAGHVGIEVKAPGLLAHQRLRERAQVQATNRGGIVDPTAGVVLPRDNPVKDFLISADAKFAAFKDGDPDFVGVLVIVWDDFIYEPIAALLHPMSGLLTRNSFHRTPDGAPVTYPAVDAVVLVRQLHQFARAAGDRPLADGRRHALDYGEPGFPYKVVLPPEALERLPAPLVSALQLVPLNPILGAEYGVSDVVHWIDLEDDSTSV
jgi:hypothetical protein